MTAGVAAAASGPVALVLWLGALGALAMVALVSALAWRGRADVPSAGLPLAVVGLLGVAAVLAAAAPQAPGLVVAAGAVLGVAGAVLGGGPLALEVLRSADREDAARAGSGSADGVEDAAAILRGGRWIGALERGGIAAAILTGWLAGVAVVLGVKGLGRYPELRHPGAAERFIIGTLVSVLWACACAGVALLVRG